jgi:murein L,D-transpeptidase YafK
MMIRTLLVLLALLVALPASARPVNARVARALREKRPLLVKLFRRAGVTYPARRVLIRVFKRERSLELWAEAKGGTFRKIKAYPVCAASGGLGPKRRQGDLQVPEGYYHIRVFNPWSAYHLSMGINYPNASDRVLGHRADLGGAIMIHGNCVSIGCVAIEDGPASEVYLAATEAWARGRKRIPVHIFPTRLDEEGMSYLRRHYRARPALIAFWELLLPGYRHFEEHHTLPRVKVDHRGRYQVTPQPTLHAARAR